MGRTDSHGLQELGSLPRLLPDRFGGGLPGLLLLFINPLLVFFFILGQRFGADKNDPVAG